MLFPYRLENYDDNSSRYWTDGYVYPYVRRFEAHRGRQSDHWTFAMCRNRQGHSPIFNPQRQQATFCSKILDIYAHQRRTIARNLTTKGIVLSKTKREVTPYNM